MSNPLSYSHRMQIIKLRESGMSYSAISKEVKCSIRTAQRLWSSYQKKGELGLKTKYHQSGRKRAYSSAIQAKIEGYNGSSVGAPYVRSILLQDYPEEAVPHERTIQRWWSKGNMECYLPKSTKSTSNWTGEVHHTWQIDGKSELKLQDGQKLSWIKIADEASGSDLQTRLFSQSNSRRH